MYTEVHKNRRDNCKKGEIFFNFIATFIKLWLISKQKSHKPKLT